MKKTTKRISLHRETLRDLQAAVGGTPPIYAVTEGQTCPDHSCPCAVTYHCFATQAGCLTQNSNCGQIC